MRRHLTLNEKVPVNQGLFMYKLFLNIFVLSGVLMALSIIVGIGFGGFRVLRRKLRKARSMTTPFSCCGSGISKP